MIIKNLNFHLNNTNGISQNNLNAMNNNTSLNPIKSNNLPNTNKITANIENEKKMENEKMKALISRLNTNQSSEFEAQRGMSFLQEKEMCLNKLKVTGDTLKELSEQYKSSNLSEGDKKNVEKQAENLLKNIDDLMNDNGSRNNNVMNLKSIPIKDPDGKIDLIFSQPLNITLEIDKLDNTNLSDTSKIDILNDDHFKNKVSIKALLENTSIIEEKFLTPVQKAIEDVDSAKSNIYHKFIDAYSSATTSINDLFKSGQMSKYIKDEQIIFQKSLYSAVSSLRFQSSNISRDNVSELLKEI